MQLYFPLHITFSQIPYNESLSLEEVLVMFLGNDRDYIGLCREGLCVRVRVRVDTTYLYEYVDHMTQQ
jgi:hypothetical protein